MNNLFTESGDAFDPISPEELIYLGYSMDNLEHNNTNAYEIIEETPYKPPPRRYISNPPINREDNEPVNTFIKFDEKDYSPENEEYDDKDDEDIKSLISGISGLGLDKVLEN